uniref:chromophore lyase cpcS/cpeS n=1 Tax=Rhodaphanes brevistipitata TaxID=446136 RepID=UPI001FCD08F0|nr:chromophore lyase cpcS/cpeS [Rhodaphanes brevistipitata]UNJ18545.1 chromophore lyase cpcS/cpeS [Rhodaphanes brevistipitata]
MNMQNFLSTLQGKWLSQQTLYNVCLEQTQSHNCEVFYDYKSNYELLMNKLQAKSKKFKTLDTLQISWTNGMPHLKNEVNYVVYFFSMDELSSGDFIKWNRKRSNSLIKGKFNWSQAGILNFIVSNDIFSINEKIYLPTYKLRLSTSVIKKYGICIFVSFVSEIKFNIIDKKS